MKEQLLFMISLVEQLSQLADPNRADKELKTVWDNIMSEMKWRRGRGILSMTQPWH